MKALIFGAGGQVGRALARLMPDAAVLRRADCDVGDPGQVRRAIAAHAPDLVLNAAAYTDVDKAEREPEAARRTNAEAPGLIAAAARQAGARSVHLSTDFVFAGTQSTPYRPDHPTDPAGVYARSKRDGERAALAADPAALVVRTAWIHAGRGRNFVTNMLRLMRERDSIGVVADQIGTPTQASSLASALLGLVRADARGIHHFTDAGVASWYDFAVAIEELAFAAGLLERRVTILPIATADFPTAARRPAYSVLDKSATWARLGAPAPHWREGVKGTIEEVRANG